MRYKNETALWHGIKRELRKHGKFDRIETGNTSLGVPDIDGYITGFGAIKIELKHCKDEKKGFVLRPAQHRYMQDRIKAGDQNVWILACLDLPNRFEMLWIHGHETLKLIKNSNPLFWSSLSHETAPFMKF